MAQLLTTVLVDGVPAKQPSPVGPPLDCHVNMLMAAAWRVVIRPRLDGVAEVSAGHQKSGVAAKGFVPNGVPEFAFTVTIEPFETPDGELIVKPELGVKFPPPPPPVENTDPPAPTMCEPTT